MLVRSTSGLTYAKLKLVAGFAPIVTEFYLGL